MNRAGKERYDAVVVGSGPNGLAAAITLARAGDRVLVLEAKDSIGGGSRSAELTLPGFLHDTCSAVHPLALASPLFLRLPLADYGLAWAQPPVALAHPLDDGSAVALHRSVAETAAGLKRDGKAYANLMGPLVRAADRLLPYLLGPLRLPRYPLPVVRFGVFGLMSAQGLGRSIFRAERARALLAGMAAHSMLPLEAPASAAFGLVLGMLGHAVGWPFARGGSQRIVDALAAYLHDLGGSIITSYEVESLAQLPRSRTTMLDVTPRQVLQVAGNALPTGYRDRLSRYRYGPGVCKVDYALDGPVPWTAPVCAQAGTVHLGGTEGELAEAIRAVWDGEHPDWPFVVVAQPSLFDPSRAPEGQHTLWAYCHVPNGSMVDMSERIEAQIERFAPGFRARIIAKATRTAAEMEAHNPNYVGGDINGGVEDIRQLFTRPVPRWVPYSTPVRGLYICSSATPPGGGVHGMCGYHAARAALRARR